MFTETVVVSGMHCNHCVASVTEEIEESVAGVRSVEVDLATGRTVVTTDRHVGADELVAAVAAAGFTATALEPVPAV